MAQLLQLASQKRDALLAIMARYGASEARIFGSAAREQDDANSDLDILVCVPKSTSLFVLAALEQDLAEAMHCAVDLVVEDELHPRIRERVLREARPL